MNHLQFGLHNDLILKCLTVKNISIRLCTKCDPFMPQCILSSQANNKLFQLLLSHFNKSVNT